MHKIIIFLSLIITFSTQVFAGNLQNANLNTSLDKKGDEIYLYDFYTYLTTSPLVFKGEDVFSALTFRGDGIKILLSKEDNSINAVIAGQTILLSRVQEDVANLPDGYHKLTPKSELKVRLDHASLGESYRIKAPLCFPGFTCFSHTIKVTPHRTKITIIGEDGDAFCISRGFNRTKENDSKVDDTYSLGECR